MSEKLLISDWSPQVSKNVPRHWVEDSRQNFFKAIIYVVT